jgi:hypothetical protein
MMSDRPSMLWPYYVATALSLGWGIRGNYGHEYGAMIAGALAVCLMSERPDWHLRAAEFGLLGAVGWSFGGSMSYMHVVAYTHSGDSPNVLYAVVRAIYGDKPAHPARVHIRFGPRATIHQTEKR